MYFEQISTVYNKFFRTDNNGKKRDNMGIPRRGNGIMVRYQEIRKSNPHGGLGFRKIRGIPNGHLNAMGYFELESQEEFSRGRGPRL
jgi:hypothetical protein